MNGAEPLHVNVLGARTIDDQPGPGTRLMVLVHGYGADENDLAPLAPLYDPEGQFFAVCPRGPNDVPPWGAGWYDRDIDGNVDTAGFIESVDRLDATIDQVCGQHGLDRSQAVVIGFSQGAAATLALTLRQGAGTRPAAIACLSGMLQQPDGMPYAWDAGDGDVDRLPPVYVQHGTHDPMVDIARGHHVRDTLRAHGLDVGYDDYPMGHEIRPEAILDLRNWLAAH